MVLAIGDAAMSARGVAALDTPCTTLGKPLVRIWFPGHLGQRWAPQRWPPAVMFRRRSDETIFRSLRSRPETITKLVLAWIRVR
jgi:hypothetical protein